MAAAFFKTPELMLDQTEARAIGEAVADVGSYYDTKISGEALAWINLATVLGMAYGTRAMVILHKRRSASSTKTAPSPAAPEKTAVDGTDLPDATLLAHVAAAG